MDTDEDLDELRGEPDGIIHGRYQVYRQLNIMREALMDISDALGLPVPQLREMHAFIEAQRAQCNTREAAIKAGEDVDIYKGWPAAYTIKSAPEGLIQQVAALAGREIGPPPVLEEYRLEGESDTDMRARLRERLKELRHKLLMNIATDEERVLLDFFESVAWLGEA